MKGTFIVEIERNGKIISKEEHQNLITKEGLSYLLEWAFGSPYNWNSQRTSPSFLLPYPFNTMYPSHVEEYPMFIGLMGNNANISENDTYNTVLTKYGEVSPLAFSGKTPTNKFYINDYLTAIRFLILGFKPINNRTIETVQPCILASYSYFTIYGLFITTIHRPVNRFQSNMKLFSVSKFSKPKTVYKGDIVYIKYKLEFPFDII